MLIDSKLSIIAPLFIVGLLQSASSNPRGLTERLKLLNTLLSTCSSVAPPASTQSGEGASSSTGSSKKINSYQGFLDQADWAIAALECKFLATKEAQEFFKGASRYGLPSYDGLIFRDNFIASYNHRLRHPNWVLEHLTQVKMSIRKARRRRHDMFLMDRQLHDYFRSVREDYKNSGYGRGQFSPSLDNWFNQKFMNQAYLLSNVAPQVHNLNSDKCPWARLEKYVTYLARRWKNTYVLTGALYLPTSGVIAGPGDQEVVSYKQIGSNRVSVPTHFYKITLGENHDGRLAMEAFVIPNSQELDSKIKFDSFRIDIVKDLPELEKNAGLKFFGELDRSNVEKIAELLHGYTDKMRSHEEE